MQLVQRKASTNLLLLLLLLIEIASGSFSSVVFFPFSFFPFFGNKNTRTHTAFNSLPGGRLLLMAMMVTMIASKKVSQSL